MDRPQNEIERKELRRIIDEAQRATFKEDKLGRRINGIKRKFSNSTSIYYGVDLRKDKMSKPWRARLKQGRKDHIYIGTYATEEEAARAYDKLVKEMNLNRPLNFPS